MALSDMTEQELVEDIASMQAAIRQYQRELDRREAVRDRGPNQPNRSTNV